MSKTQLLASTAAGKMYADADEKEEERKDTQPSTEIMDAVERCMDAVERMADSFGKRFDAMGARMDAAEEELKKPDRKDEEKEEKEEKVEDRKDEEKEEKEEKVEDRKDRKDEEKEEKVEDRKDEDKAEKHGDAASAETLQAIRAEISQLRAENRDLRRIVPKPISDSDSAKLLEVQALADDVYIEAGRRAPGPMVNEDLGTYRRRLAIDLQKHSPRLKDADLWAVADDASFNAIEKMVYADALDTFRRPPVGDALGQLRGVTRKSGGHEFTEYHGDSASWMGALSLNAVRGKASVTEVMRAMGGDRR